MRRPWRDDACKAWDAQLHMHVSFKLTRPLSCPKRKKRYKSTTKIVNAILQLRTRVYRAECTVF